MNLLSLKISASQVPYTRCTAELVAKGSNVNSIFFMPQTADEFLFSILFLRKTQEAPLNQCNTICHSFEIIFNELKTSVDLLTS